MPPHNRPETGGRRWWVSVVGLVAVGVTGACGPQPDQPPAVQGRAVATYTDPSAYRVGPSELRRITARLDPDSPQRAILADRRVSRNEVDAAWEGYAQCMRRAGFPVTMSAWDPVTNATRIFTYARSGTATTAATTTATTTTATTTTATTTASSTPPSTLPSTPRTARPTARPTIDTMTAEEVERVDACDERYWFPVSAVYAADTPPHMDPPLASVVGDCMVRRGYAVQGRTDFGGMVGAVRGQARGERVQDGRDCLAAALTDLYPDLPYYPRP